MLTTREWKFLVALFLLYTATLVNCQDEDDDNEEPVEEKDNATDPPLPPPPPPPPSVSNAQFKQLNTILESIGKDDVVGVVESALKLRASIPVQNMIIGNVKAFEDGRKNAVNRRTAAQGPIILPTEACYCPAKSRQAGGPGPDHLEMVFLMNQLNKIVENVASSNMTGVVENALKIRAPEYVQRMITNNVRIFAYSKGAQPTTLPAYACPCSGYRTIPVVRPQVVNLKSFSQTTAKSPIYIVAYQQRKPKMIFPQYNL